MKITIVCSNCGKQTLYKVSSLKKKVLTIPDHCDCCGIKEEARKAADFFLDQLGDKLVPGAKKAAFLKEFKE